MFTLITLPYADDALQPVISKETLQFHHGKHLQTYVDNLNGLIAGTDYENKTLEDILCTAHGGMFNNAGQLLNHNLYFTQLKPFKEVNKPVGTLAEAIKETFGSFEIFKETFEQKGITLFGSGWVWLSADKNGKLVITQESNAQNPLTKGLKPIITADVWEHAYYLDYQNRRAAHLNALWNLINWEEAEHRYCI